jgi:hypothetical protein
MATDYTDDEWAEAVGPDPLQSIGAEELALLHRHWMWANVQRERFDELLADDSEEASFETLATRSAGHMLLWYALLRSVIEGLVEDRGVVLGGTFGSDIASLGDDLRRARNAILHVPESGSYYDPRLVRFISRADSVDLVRRVHRGLGRLLIGELRQRAASS